MLCVQWREKQKERRNNTMNTLNCSFNLQERGHSLSLGLKFHKPKLYNTFLLLMSSLPVNFDCYSVWTLCFLRCERKLLYTCSKQVFFIISCISGLSHGTLKTDCKIKGLQSVCRNSSFPRLVLCLLSILKEMSKLLFNVPSAI